MRAFAVQGFSSATTTLLIGGVIERLRVRLGDTLQVRIAASVLATAAAAVFHVCLHLAAGTPEIVRTVVPSVGVGFLFAVTYTVWTFDEARSSSGARPGTP